MPKISIDLASGTIERDQTVIGIDLGTTNSLIASIDSGNSLPYCIGDDLSIVPSALFFDGKDVLVGREALHRMDLDPELGIYSVKRLMGKSYEDLKDHLSYFNYNTIKAHCQRAGLRIVYFKSRLWGIDQYRQIYRYICWHRASKRQQNSCGSA